MKYVNHEFEVYKSLRLELIRWLTELTDASIDAAVTTAKAVKMGKIGDDDNDEIFQYYIKQYELNYMKEDKELI